MSQAPGKSSLGGEGYVMEPECGPGGFGGHLGTHSITYARLLTLRLAFVYGRH
jgi:hypothetical protein